MSILTRLGSAGAKTAATALAAAASARRHHDAMLRLARGYVPSMAVAEEVVQDT